MQQQSARIWYPSGDPEGTITRYIPSLTSAKEKKARRSLAAKNAPTGGSDQNIQSVTKVNNVNDVVYVLGLGLARCGGHNQQQFS